MSIPSKLAHYEILEKIGAGGMGEVYRARDSKLDREVALKILPAAMADDPNRFERFQREAKTVASLNHPHIVTLHSIEEDQGFHFLTMELVDGEGLEYLTPSDGLQLNQVFDIGVAIADALAAAHENNVVHRDLKPSNIMVTGSGYVKVLDFGLAKLTEEEPVTEDADTMAAPLTQEGAVIGTVPYMSPEQLRGQAVDHRSDIFSLGTILYELTTGRRPFQGDTNSDITSSILRDTPPSVTEIKKEIPSRLGRLIERCLEKDPKDRSLSTPDIRSELQDIRREFESGNETNVSQTSGTRKETPSRRGLLLGIVTVVAVLTGLAFVMSKNGGELGSEQTELATPSTIADNKSIAVMPFVNMSSDPEQEYFSDGITEELQNLLAQIPELKVIARSSAFSFKGSDLSASEIAAKLKVANILEGSVRKAGDNVRITAHLVDTKSNQSLWSKTWDRTLEDIFAVQDEIAADVISELEVTLLAGLPNARTTNTKAYDLYLRAAAYLEWGLGPTADDLRTGIGFLEEAVTLDPEFALGFASLSQARSALYYVSRTNELQYAEQARIDALHAIDLNPNLAKCHLAMGLYHYRSSLDYESALLALGVARRLAPRNAEILSWTGTIKKRQAKFDEAAALLEVALSFDPRNLTILGELAVVERCRGNYALVLEYLDRSIAIKPSANARGYRASHILASTGDTRPMREFLSQAPDSFRIREDWSELLEMEGDLEGAIGHRQTLVDSSTDDSQRASQLVKLARLYWLKGNHAESQRLAAMAIPKLGEADDWVNLIHLAMALAISGQPQDVRLQIERALATPRLQRDLLSRCRAQLMLAEVYVMNGDPAAAVRTLKERLRVTQEVSVKNLMMRPIFNSLHEREDFKALGDATKP